MKPYADTNFITRLYLSLPSTGEAVSAMKRLKSKGDEVLPITFHHRLETINAFQLLVFAGAQSPHQARVTLKQASLALATFRGDLAASAFLQETSLPLGEVEQQFEELALRHTAKHGFRTYDLIHVASALVLECDCFWSFDAKTVKLAGLEGLRTRK